MICEGGKGGMVVCWEGGKGGRLVSREGGNSQGSKQKR